MGLETVTLHLATPDLFRGPVRMPRMRLNNIWRRCRKPDTGLRRYGDA